MTSAGYLKLGTFVLAGVTLLVSGVISLGARSWFQHTVQAETYFDESVNGIVPGSVVTYRGVTVGRVKSVGFVASKYSHAAHLGELPSRKVLVEMSLDPDVVATFGSDGIGRSVRDGLRARISRSGLAGSTYIELNFFDASAFPPPAITWKPQELYIPSVPSAWNEIQSGVERLATSLQKADLAGTVARLDTLMTDADQFVRELKVSEIRAEALALLTEVRGTNARVRQLLNEPEVDAALHDLPKITARLNTSLARVDEILHDKRVDQALTGLSDVATRAGPATADARLLIRDLRRFVAGASADLESLSADVRGAVGKLDAVTEDAKANPSRVLFGRPPARKKPGE
jgi:phospholipid/cholesterol/gamma-HCH transport system substrate-binding protein